MVGSQGRCAEVCAGTAGCSRDAYSERIFGSEQFRTRKLAWARVHRLSSQIYHIDLAVASSLHRGVADVVVCIYVWASHSCASHRGVYLTVVYLIGACISQVCILQAYTFTAVHLMGVHFIDVHLTDVYLLQACILQTCSWWVPFTTHELSLLITSK